MAYLGECGFSPSQSVNYSWAVRGARKVIPYENPEGRRVNALGVLVPFGERRSLWWDAVGRTIRSEDVLAVLDAIPRGEGELVVVLDNAGIHHSRLVHEAETRFAEQGIHLYYLPSYSPELNLIESYFGVIKSTELPERTYTSIDSLRAAVNQAFYRTEARLLAQPQQHLWPAA